MSVHPSRRSRQRPAASPGARSKVTMVGAVVAAVAAVAVAGLRIHSVLYGGPIRLRLGNDVPLGSVPPLSSDRDVQRNRLLALRSAWLTTQGSRNGALWAALGGMALQAGDPMGARAALKRALALEPHNARAWERLGNAQVRLGLFNDAATTWNTLIALDPQKPAGYIELSRTLTVLGRRAEAADILRRAQTAVPAADAAGQGALIQEYDRRGELAHALQLSRHLLDAAPRDEGAQFLLAMLLFKTQQLTEARRLLEHLLAAQHHQVQIRRYLAAILTNPLSAHQDARLAEHLLLEAANLDPTDGGPLLDLATLYADQGRSRPAAYVLIRLLGMAPASATARLQLAHAFHRLGMESQAQVQDRIAQRLFARNREADALRTQIDHRPSDSKARLALGLHFMRWGEYGRALPELEAAVCLSPHFAAARHALATYYRALDVPPPDYGSGVLQ